VRRVFRALLICSSLFAATRATAGAACPEPARAAARALVATDCDCESHASRRAYVACAAQAVARAADTAGCVRWTRRMARRTYAGGRATAACSLRRTTAAVMPAPEPEGRVLFARAADSSFDAYTSSPTTTQQQWMRDHFRRMRTYAPYFDSRLSWYPDAWAYKDVYAIYTGTTSASQHPEWILRDASGQRLYIPYACSNGTCPQYAADIGNRDFRARWIADAQAMIARGYRGLFVDDVNMRLQVSDGSGTFVAPFDPRLGRTMTADDWRGYMADFAEEIRAAFPDTEIIHNQVWFFAPWSDTNVIRTILAADYIEVERGFTDTGIRAGVGQYGFQSLLLWMDVYHYCGKAVVLDSDASWGREYSVATYLLVSNGQDTLGTRINSTPDSWWTGYDVNLGSALGRRYRWNGLFRRDFTGGMVLVNQPDQPSITVDLGGTYRGLDGALRTSLTLGAASGVVLQQR
jgi:hypothetical protein